MRLSGMADRLIELVDLKLRIGGIGQRPRVQRISGKRPRKKLVRLVKFPLGQGYPGEVAIRLGKILVQTNRFLEGRAGSFRIAGAGQRHS